MRLIQLPQGSFCLVIFDDSLRHFCDVEVFKGPSLPLARVPLILITAA
jgi:hypothetical protein